LVIEVSALMASVHVELASAVGASISDLARDTLRLALENMKRGLETPSAPPGLPRASAQPGLPSAPTE
ncbi:MAG: hypothetical protein ACRDID_15950, partial [Ktedonobacterales bacterium]